MKRLLPLLLCLGAWWVLSAGCGSSFFGSNHPPHISALTANGKAAPQDTPLVVTPGSKVLFACTANDPDQDPITYKWSATQGSDPQTAQDQPASLATWTAPMTEGPVTITCSASDDRGGLDTATASILVANNGINHVPQVSLAPATVTLAPNGTAVFTATATDQDAGDQANLTYTFFASAGSIAPSPTDKTTANYTAPAVQGTNTIYCVVTDGRGGYALATATVTVKTP